MTRESQEFETRESQEFETRESREFELKARLTGPVAELCRRLEREGWELRFRGGMEDRTFDTEDEELDSRDEVLRVRRFTAPDEPGHTVVGWKGPAAEREGFKRREEIETRVGSGESVRGIFARLGFGRVTRRIDRRIHLYVSEGVSVRVEEYPRMDVLVEIEGPPDEVRRRLPELGLPREAWKPWPLRRFVRRYEERTGETARLAAGATDADARGPAGEGAASAGEDGASGGEGPASAGEGAASAGEGAP